MAKIQKSISFSNAYFDADAMEIIELDKGGDETGRYSLEKLINDWNGVMGISLVIKQTDDAMSDGESL